MSAGSGADAAAVIACSEAIARFYARLDGLEAGSVGAMFEADGVWHRQGAVLRGPAAVDAALGQRPAGRTSLHLVGNLRCSAEGHGLWRASYLVQVYRHDAAGAATGPAPVEGSLFGIAQADDTWVLGPEGTWRLRRKDGVVLFLRT